MKAVKPDASARGASVLVKAHDCKFRTQSPSASSKSPRALLERALNAIAKDVSECKGRGDEKAESGHPRQQAYAASALPVLQACAS